MLIPVSRLYVCSSTKRDDAGAIYWLTLYNLPPRLINANRALSCHCEGPSFTNIPIGVQITYTFQVSVEQGLPRTKALVDRYPVWAIS